MTASQLPGQTLQPVPPSALIGGDDEWSLLQKAVELSRKWAGSGVTGLPQDDAYALWQKLCRNIYIKATS